MRWAFFVDANLDPKVARLLEQEGYRAEYSDLDKWISVE
jgi:predicted nuclease of predicted toxin-antitoxin system